MSTIESSPDAVVIAPSHPDVGSESLLTRIARVFTSTDHKVTGQLYLVGGLLGLIATITINVMLAVERLDGVDTVLGYQILPQLVDAQRVGLVFATLLPLAMAGCIAYVPMQLGARSIAFPRLASAGFWMWFGGAILTALALLNNGGTLGSDTNAVDLFIVAIGLMALGLTASAVSVATSVLTTRAPGMTLRRVPPFSWSALVFGLGIILVMPVLVGTLAYLFLDHRNGSSGFGGNAGIFQWVGWIVTQPASLLFAVPAIGVLAEIVPITFGRRTPARGVMFAGIALVGAAALAGVTQQNIQALPWSGSGLSTDDLGQKAKDLVPFVLFNGLPLIGMMLVVLVALQVARPGDGMRVKVSAAGLFAFFGFSMILVGALGTVLYSADDLGLQGTVFEEATLVYIVYGGVLAAMGAVIHWGPKLWGSRIEMGKAAPLALLGLAGTILAAFPYYIAGFLDQPAGIAYDDSDLAIWSIISLVGHGLMAITVVGFIGLLLASLRSDDAVGDDPWDAQTLEWATTSPAPRNNFVDVPIVHSAEPLLDLKSAAASNDRSDA